MRQGIGGRERWELLGGAGSRAGQREQEGDRVRAPLFWNPLPQPLAGQKAGHFPVWVGSCHL